MGSNRLNLVNEEVGENQARCGGAFMAVPAMLLGVMDAATFQQRLYQWAFEQARQTVQAQRPAPTRDLFAMMN